MPLPMNANTNRMPNPTPRQHTFSDDAPFHEPDPAPTYEGDGDDETSELEDRIAARTNKQTSKLEAILSGQAAQIAEQRVMSQLLADPNLRAVVEAQRAGKKIKVIPLNDDGSSDDDGGQSGGQQASPPVDLDSMTPAELTQHIIKEAKKQAPKPKEDPVVTQLQQQVAMLTKHIQEENAKKVDGEVQAVANRYPDFEEYKPQMLQLSQENPGLKVEELYKIAKLRAGVSLTEVEDVQTERPTSSAARPSNLRRPKGPVVGQAAFNNRLHEILANKTFGQARDDF